MRKYLYIRYYNATVYSIDTEYEHFTVRGRSKKDAVIQVGIRVHELYGKTRRFKLIKLSFDRERSLLKENKQ